jgi:hypothetical protein
MSFFKAIVKWQRKAQTEGAGVFADLYQVVRADLGSPVVDDVDRIVTTVSMANGAYTLAAQPDVPRNITITHTAVSTVDTLGTITITGTDIGGAVITEVITPLNGTIASGAKAFKTVISVVGAGWAVVAGADSITVGVGGLIGLPHKLAVATHLYGVLNGTREGTLPTLTVSSTVLSQNTVDFSTAWGGTQAYLTYLV